MSKQVVTYAKVHQDLFIPGLGSLGTTLPPKAKSSPCHMCLSEVGLLVEIGPFRSIVPYANIVIMALAPEEAPKGK